MDFNQFLKRTEEFEYQNEATFRFNDSFYKVKSNNKDLILELKEYFSEWYTEEVSDDCFQVIAWNDPEISFNLDYTEYKETGKKRIKEVYKDIGEYRVVKKTKTDVKFIVGGNKLYATGPLMDNPNQLINFINAQFMEVELQGDSMLFHAAGVSKNNEGIILAAQSGKGKSTTALNLMNEGLDFVSNDRIVLKKEEDKFTMVGVPKHPRINPGTILNNPKLKGLLKDPERFQNMNQNEIWNWEEKYDAIIPEYYGQNKFHLNANCKGLLIIDWGDNDYEPRIDSLDLKTRLDLLPAIMKAPSLMTPIIHEKKGTLKEKDYIEFLNGLPLFVLTGAKKSTKAISEILNHFY